MAAAPEGEARSYWFLVLLAFLADAASVLGLLGFRPTRLPALALVGALAVIGVLVSIPSLVAAVKLWASPRGRYYAASFHLRRILASLGAFTIGLVFGWIVISQVASADRCPESSTDSTTRVLTNCVETSD